MQGQWDWFQAVLPLCVPPKSPAAPFIGCRFMDHQGCGYIYPVATELVVIAPKLETLVKDLQPNVKEQNNIAK